MQPFEIILLVLMIILAVFALGLMANVNTKENTYTYRNRLKITKQGRHIQREIERTCDDCGCTFEFNIYDTSLYTDHAKITHRRIWCPNCEECVHIEVTDKEKQNGFKW